MMATTFWSVDGRPMSAAEFIARLFGDLPELFKDEDELRALWGQPDTRKALLESLSEKGYGDDELFRVRAGPKMCVDPCPEYSRQRPRDGRRAGGEKTERRGDKPVRDVGFVLIFKASALNRVNP
jgi:EcoEI R protein C-terminal